MPKVILSRYATRHPPKEEAAPKPRPSTLNPTPLLVIFEEGGGALLGAHEREGNHIADGCSVGEEHQNAVDADAEAGGWGHAVFDRHQKVFVHIGCLEVASGLFRGLCLESLALVDRVRQLRKAVCVLTAVDEELEALGEAGLGAVWLREWGYLLRMLAHKCRLDQLLLTPVFKGFVDKLADACRTRCPVDPQL